MKESSSFFEKKEPKKLLLLGAPRPSTSLQAARGAAWQSIFLAARTYQDGLLRSARNGERWVNALAG
jgi:hypothetical protein